MYNSQHAEEYSLARIGNFPNVFWGLRILELWDTGTKLHVFNTAYLAVKVAESMKWDPQEWGLMAILHDLGKTKVSREILTKPGRPNDLEWEILRTHPEIGAKIISIINMPLALKMMSIGATWCHHEKWDGSGYPRKLKGNEIPVTVRIIAMLDVIEALLAKRSYKPTLPLNKVLEIVTEGLGTHFDPDLRYILDIIPGIIRET